MLNLVSRFASNKKMAVEIQFKSTGFQCPIAVTKPTINSASKQTNIASSINHSNGNSIRW